MSACEQPDCDDFCEQQESSQQAGGAASAHNPTVMTQDHTG